MNKVEQLTCAKLNNININCTNYGYPDLIVYNQDKFVFVEVKKSSSADLGYNQFITFQLLDKSIPVYICFDGDLTTIYRFKPKHNRKLSRYLKKDKPVDFRKEMEKYLDYEIEMKVAKNSIEEKIQKYSKHTNKKKIKADDIFPKPKVDLSEFL